MQDDLGAVAARLGHVRLEDVEAVLGLGAGQGEVVGVVAAVRVLEDLEAGEGDRPQDEDDHEVPGAPRAGAVQYAPVARVGRAVGAGL